MIRRLPYHIRTERLELRCWSPADAEAMRAALDRSDAHLRPWIPFMAKEPRSLKATVQWLREIRSAFDSDQHYRYAVFAAGELIGEAMLIGRGHGDDTMEVGYWVDVDHAGHGYATESSAAMVQVGIQCLGLPLLELCCSPTNLASVRVAEKLGFRHDATLRDRFRNPLGELQASMIFSLFAADYPDSMAASLRLEGVDAAGRDVSFD